MLLLTTKFPCLQEMPPSDPSEQGDEGDWDTVGEPAGGSRSPAPTVEELLAQMTRQPPAAEGSTEPATAAPEEAAATEAQQEAPAVVWTSLDPLHRWVPGPTTRWASRTTRLALHGT
jgi:hypothetical protein